ncbi:hypothetical protein BH09SUM1_BH09SUM1_14360 [soil metagenome]
MKKFHNLKGFTLIELLIVVAIIAILAAIAVPNFLEAQVRAKVSRTKADMRTYATAIESYAVDNNVYPIIIGVGGSKTGAPSISGFSVFYPGTRGVSSRFIRLTTPIAYITSVYADPFIAQSVKFALDGGSAATPPPPLPEYDTFDYVDSKSLSTGGVLGGTRGASATSGGAWQIVGVGPDKINAFGGGTTAYPAIIHNRGVDYDATNGTLSVGDIVRIGGRGQIYTLLPAIDRVNNKQNF